MESADHLALAGSVQILHIDDIVGNGLFARRNFKEDDIIFEEDPVVSCQFSWNRAYGYLACDFCMRPLESAEENARRLAQNSDVVLPYHKSSNFFNPNISCDFCGVLYCTESCKSSAWNQFHEVLCLHSCTPDSSHPLVVLEESWRKIHYPPETTSVMLLARILATIVQARDREMALSTFMRFCHRTVNEQQEITHKLLGDEFVTQLESLRKCLEVAFKGRDVQQWLSPDGFLSLMALVGTNGQGIGTSSLGDWVKDCDNLQDLTTAEKSQLDLFIDDLYEKLDDVVGGFLNNEGSGLFAFQSACNHSCEPNAVISFPHSNFRLVMTALKDIKEGEEICISYLDDCMLHRSRHSRQKFLRENYIFQCQCMKCQAEGDDPDLTSEEEEEEMIHSSCSASENDEMT